MKDKSYPFQFAEGCMYNYLENVAKVEALRDELRALDRVTVKVQKYEEQNTPCGFVDNIPDRLIHIDALESLILDLERHTRPIGRLLVDLESPYNLSPERQQMLGILRVRYFGKNTWERAVTFLRMSHGTFGERRKQLVELAIVYLGLREKQKVLC